MSKSASEFEEPPVNPIVGLVFVSVLVVFMALVVLVVSWPKYPPISLWLIVVVTGLHGLFWSLKPAKKYLIPLLTKPMAFQYSQGEFGRVLNGIWLVMAVGLVFFSSWLYRPGSNVYEVRADGQLISRPWGILFPAGKEIASVFYGNIEIETSVMPITSNPKARKITYQVQARVGNSEQSIKYAMTHGLGTYLSEEELERTVRFCVYEINDARSSELGEFYNPLDENQMSGFKQVVNNGLTRCLKQSGIVARAKSFDAH